MAQYILINDHNLYVAPIDGSIDPKVFAHSKDYTKFWVVNNTDCCGCTFFYVGKGHKQAPGQYVVWYPNGQLWASYGKTIEAAIVGAMKDGWKYAT